MDNGNDRSRHPGIDGHAAERAAERHLLRQGLHLLWRNYRCRGGEIDLVMLDGNGLVFVEVRARSGTRYGGAAASIGQHKRRRLILAARRFLARYPAQACRPCRFDVVTLQGAAHGRFQIHWLRDAFRSDE